MQVGFINATLRDTNTRFNALIRYFKLHEGAPDKCKLVQVIFFTIDYFRYIAATLCSHISFKALIKVSNHMRLQFTIETAILPTSYFLQFLLLNVITTECQINR